MLGLQVQQLSNVRLICHDAVEVLEQQIPAASVDEILILFPDPWPKKRHHKRRLVQAPFATLAASRLAPGGVLRVATDWQPYALEMLETLRALPQLANLAADAGASFPGPPSVNARASSAAASGWGMRCGTSPSGVT